MSEAPTYTPDRKVLSPQDLNTILEATYYLSEIRRIHGEFEEEVSTTTENARRQGYEEGYAQGRQAALSDLGSAVKASRARIMASENDLFAIMMTAIERLIGDLDQADLAKRCLRRALEDAVGNLSVTIRVPPEEHDLFKADIAVGQAVPGQPEIKAIEVDSLLKPGEVILETPKGRIHVGLRHQLTRLQDGLERAEAHYEALPHD